jgi:hypothetical protein
MRIGNTVFWTVAAIVASSAAFAAGWSRYGNARFNYWIDIPPGFSALDEAENGDGGVATSPRGHAELRVWGSYLTEGDFRREAEWRAKADSAEGWSISYHKLRPEWAAWSGSKGGRILYERAIPVCDGAAAYFRLEYDRDSASAFDPVISRLARSLRGGAC